MKNIFKFMGIALVFGALTLTSCKKDDDETYQVSFNGTNWNATGIYVEETSNPDIIFWQIQNGETEDDPMVCGQSAIVPGTYTLGVDNAYYWFTYLENDNDYVGDDFKKQPISCVTTIGAFDVTAQTVTMSVAAQLVDMTAPDAGQMPLNVTLTDAKWSI